MINDEIIRSFANLHPDTPIDGKLFAVPLRVIKRMLETAVAAEREACAKLCEAIADDAAKEQDFHTIGACELCADEIRARGQK